MAARSKTECACLIEALRSRRDAAGGNMAVGMRLNCDELLAGGYGTKEAYEILKTIVGFEASSTSPISMSQSSPINCTLACHPCSSSRTFIDLTSKQCEARHMESRCSAYWADSRPLPMLRRRSPRAFAT